MRTTITFPPGAPALKLASRSATNPPLEKAAATPDEERRRLQKDREALQERESDLLACEERLRAMQAEIEADRGAPPVATRRATASPFPRPASKAPFPDDAALQAAWEKLQRARELFEADQAHLRDERSLLASQQNELKRREREVTVREAAVATREKPNAAIDTSAVPGEPIASEHTISAVTRLSRGPVGLARTFFSRKK